MNGRMILMTEDEINEIPLITLSRRLKPVKAKQKDQHRLELEIKSVPDKVEEEPKQLNC